MDRGNANKVGVEGGPQNMEILEQIKEAIISGKKESVPEFVKQAIAEGFGPEEIIQKSLISAMSVVGENYQKGLMYIPEMLIAARAMKVGMKVLEPLMRGQQIKSLATVVIGTVKGDLHDIGKNLVGVMMDGAGMNVIDLGVDVTPEKFLEAVKTHSPHVLAMSALLTTTLPNMKEIIDVIKSAEINETPYLLVGGAPVTQQFADTIGADAYGKNAAEAVNKTKMLLQNR